MSSVAALKERKLQERGVVQSVGTDLPVAIRIRHTGSTAVTSVTVITGTNIILIDGAGTTTSTFASDTTLSKVIATINASGTWQAKLLDALSTDASVSRLLDGAITSGFDGNGNVVWDVLQDTSAAKQFAVCLSPFRSFDSAKGHRMHLQEVVYYATLGGAAAQLFNVYVRGVAGGSSTGLGTAEVKVMTDTSVSATKTTYLFANGIGELTGKDDQEIIVVLTDGTSISDATANYLRITGIHE